MCNFAPVLDISRWSLVVGPCKGCRWSKGEAGMKGIIIKNYEYNT